MIVPFILYICTTSVGFGLGLFFEFLTQGSIKSFNPGDFQSNIIVSFFTVSFYLIGNLIVGGYLYLRSQPLYIRQIAFQRN